MKKFFIFILIILNGFIFAQVQEYSVFGKVMDEKGQALPFASISILNSTKGTTANEKGEFELKLQEGNYQIVVQYLGFKKKSIEVFLKQNQKLNVLLYPEEIALKEVEIKSNEDPAYQVIRNTIKKRKQHYKELNSFSYRCEVYIKGVEKLKDVPEKIMGMKMEMKEEDKGIFYLSETKSTYYFAPPDRKKEIIKASRVSGQSRGFSFNRFIPMQKNIYENNLDFYFITNRPFISPISENALLFYRYKMQGTFYEDGKLINKIEVIPKSRTEPCFRGYIYIEENYWRVHSFDFYITKDAKLNFIDTLWLKQVNTKINDSLYFPVSIQYIFNFNVLGIRGSGYFIASISEYSLNNMDTINKKFFMNEIVRFEKDAIQNDSSFWNAVRPIPLSDEEKKDYLKKDSIEKITHSPKYLDSIDSRHNRFKLSNILLGYNFRKTNQHFNFSVDGLLTAGVQYNTIEGINFTLKTSMKKENSEETKHWVWQNHLRYGWANQLMGLKTSWKRADNPFNSRQYGINAQYYVEPFNHEHSISELVNTAYTLLDFRNYLKLYLKKSIDLFYHQEVFNGLYITSEASVEERNALKNATYLSIFQKKNFYTSNDPLFPFSDSIGFPTHQAMIIHLKIKYNIKQRYTTYPNEKYVWKNKYPVLYVEYTKGIPFQQSMVDYDLIQGGMNGKIELNYFGDWKWALNAGKFLNIKRMYFMDYKHFAGNQTILLNDWNTFRILNYFNFSTNDYFFQVHSEYNLRGLIVGKIPLLKKFKLEEVITFHYLYNNLLNHYVEWSVGVDKVFYVLRIEYAIAHYPFLNRPMTQFLIGLNFINARR